MNIFKKAAHDLKINTKAKSDNPLSMIASVLHGRPIWSDNDYESHVLEGYKKSWVVYKCIHLRAQAVSRLPLKVYKHKKDGEEEHLPEHDLQQLLRKPNPYYSIQSLLEFWEMSRCLSGEAYWQLVRLGRNDIPEQLYYLRPDRMNIVPDEKEYIKEYIYKINHKENRLNPEQVLYFRMLDPLNEYGGLSPLIPGGRIIDTDNEITEWNKVFFQNAARPDGAFVSDGHLNTDSFDRMNEQIKAKHLGTKNAHKPLLLEGGVKWQEIQNSHKDMDFPGLKNMTRQDICDLLGVPTSLISNRKEDGSTYNNRREARLFFWEDTVLMEGQDLTEALNNELAPRYGDDVFIKIDTSEIPALRENEDSKTERLNSKIENNWLLLNEARTADGKEPIDGLDITLAEHQAKFKNVGLLQTNSKDIVDMKEVKSLLLEVNNTLNDVKKNNRKLELFNQYKHLFDDEEIKDIKGNLLKKEITLEHAEKWFNYIKQTLPFEDRFNKLVTRLFTEQEKTVLDNLSGYEKSKNYVETKDISEGDIDDIIFSFEEQKEYFATESGPLFRNCVQVFGTDALSSLGLAIDFDLENPRVAEFLDKKVMKFAEEVNDTTIKQLKKELIEGLHEGEGIPELSKRVKGVFEDATTWRANNIARTEIIGSSNFANDEGLVQSGVVETKSWLTSIDGRERPEHAAANGQEVPVDKPFIVGGEELDYPGHYIGSPWNVCQCRCTVIAEKFKE